MLQIDQLKKLFYAYSPLKNSESLKNSYINITYNTPNEDTPIRTLYNNLITTGFLNEAVIKGYFTKKYALTKSPKHTVTIFELNSFDSRADICIVNGHSTVYEIKTEFDSFFRLEKQINDYSLLYDYVNIIIPQSKLIDSLNVLPNFVGIITYRKNKFNNISFETYRKANLNEKIDSFSQLTQLTKLELQNILNSKSKSKKTKDDIIEDILRLKTKDQINKIFRETIKNTYRDKWLFLYNNYQNIELLDYQWFFKNNISYKTVYK